MTTNSVMNLPLQEELTSSFEEAQESRDEDQERPHTLTLSSPETALEAVVVSENEEGPSCRPYAMPPSQLCRSGRSEFLCVLAWKSTAQENLGIRFQSFSNGSFRISQIDEGSLFADSPLAVGDHVVSVNNIECAGSGYNEAFRRLRQKAGAVSMVVQNIGGNPSSVTTSIIKPLPSTKLGIKFRNVNGHLFISTLAPKRLASKTLLKPCDLVLSINGVDSRRLSASDAIIELQRVRRGVTIETTSLRRQARERAIFMPLTADISSHYQPQQQQQPQPPEQDIPMLCGGRAEFIRAVAWKSTSESRLGLRFQSMDDGSFIISEIHQVGLFRNSALCVGDHATTINDVTCSGVGYQAALRQVRQLTGPVTIRAQNPRGTSGMVTASITKPSPSTRVGIGFREQDGKLCVGFCEASLLTPGDRVVSINGVNCGAMSPGDAVKLIRKARKVVTIVATQTARPESSAMMEVPALIITDDESRDVIDQHSSRYESLPYAQSVESTYDASNLSRDGCPSPELKSPQIGCGRARLTSAMVWKSTPQTPLGIKFVSYDDGSFRISRIDPDGLFAHSPLRVGDHVVSINDVTCSGSGYQEALRLARLALGAVTIITCFDDGDSQFVTASILKPTPSTCVGITFKNVEDRLCICFSSASLLNTGDLVLSINGVDCRLMRAIDATEMLRSALHVVTIKIETPLSPATEAMESSTEMMVEAESFDADDDDFPYAYAVMAMTDMTTTLPEGAIAPPFQACPLAYGRAEFISAMAWKSTKLTPLGIRFQSHEDGSFRISAMEPNGLFADSPLIVGDRVVSINQVSCRGKGYEEALRRLRANSGAVTIVVRNKGGNSNLVASSITKPTPFMLLGIGFNNVRNRLCVSSLQPQGICGESLLSAGHKIISINGVDCRFLSSKFAADMVKLVPHVITIVAEIPTNSGVVVSSS